MVLGAYLGNAMFVHAQGAATRGPTMALVNYAEVMRNYAKVKQINDSLKTQEDKYITQLKTKQAEAEIHLKKIRDPMATQADKDNAERITKDVQYQMKNMQEEALKNLNRQRVEEGAKIYWEVYHVIRQMSVMQGYELVLRYNEDWTDYNKPEKVAGRLQNPFWPMYYDKQTMDITVQVANTLNKNYGAAPAPSAGGGAAAPR
jgi:Skp family chaperone for outer membrane proteins